MSRARRKHSRSREAALDAKCSTQNAPKAPKGLLRVVAVASAIAIVVSAVIIYPLVKPPPEIVSPPMTRNFDRELQRVIDQHVGAAQAAPRNAGLRGSLGLLYAANEMWDEARRSFDNCIELGSTDPSWVYHQAIAVREAGDSDRAFEILEDVAARYPELPWLQQRFGQWLLEAGDMDAALAKFRQAATLAPDAVEPLVGQGTTLVRKKQYAEAVGLLETAVKQDPDYKAASYALGLAYRGIGRADDARRLLEAGTAAHIRYLPDPRSEQMRRLTVNFANIVDNAVGLIETGRPQEAVAQLEAVLRTHPNELSIMSNLAVAYHNLGRVDDAIEILQRAIQIDSTHFPSYINLTVYNLEKKNLDQALRYGSLAARHGQDVGQAHFIHARALAMRGRYEESLSALEKAQNLDLRDPTIYMAMGETCVKLNRLNQARAAYERGVSAVPASLPMWISLCAVCLRLDDLPAAADALENARRISPEHPRVLALGQRLAQLRGD